MCRGGSEPRLGATRPQENHSSAKTATIPIGECVHATCCKDNKQLSTLRATNPGMHSRRRAPYVRRWYSTCRRSALCTSRHGTVFDRLRVWKQRQEGQRGGWRVVLLDELRPTTRLTDPAPTDIFAARDPASHRSTPLTFIAWPAKMACLRHNLHATNPEGGMPPPFAATTAPAAASQDSSNVTPLLHLPFVLHQCTAQFVIFHEVPDAAIPACLLVQIARRSRAADVVHYSRWATAGESVNDEGLTVNAHEGVVVAVVNGGSRKPLEPTAKPCGFCPAKHAPQPAHTLTEQDVLAELAHGCWQGAGEKRERRGRGEWRAVRKRGWGGTVFKRQKQNGSAMHSTILEQPEWMA